MNIVTLSNPSLCYPTPILPKPGSDFQDVLVDNNNNPLPSYGSSLFVINYSPFLHYESVSEDLRDSLTIAIANTVPAQNIIRINYRPKILVVHEDEVWESRMYTQGEIRKELQGRGFEVKFAEELPGDISSYFAIISDDSEPDMYGIDTAMARELSPRAKLIGVKTIGNPNDLSETGFSHSENGNDLAIEYCPREASRFLVTLRTQVGELLFNKGSNEELFWNFIKNEQGHMVQTVDRIRNLKDLIKNPDGFKERANVIHDNSELHLSKLNDFFSDPGMKFAKIVMKGGKHCLISPLSESVSSYGEFVRAKIKDPENNLFNESSGTVTPIDRAEEATGDIVEITEIPREEVSKLVELDILKQTLSAPLKGIRDVCKYAAGGDTNIETEGEAIASTLEEHLEELRLARRSLMLHLSVLSF